MSVWMLICQSKYFDIEKAFENNETITWPQIEGMDVYDVTYFYVTSPYRAILYKCKVEETQLHHMDDDVEGFVLHPAFYDKKQTYVRLRLLQSYPEGMLTDKKIKKNGYKMLQFSSKISNELQEYIEKETENIFGETEYALKWINAELVPVAESKERKDFRLITKGEVHNVLEELGNGQEWHFYNSSEEVDLSDVVQTGRGIRLGDTIDNVFMAYGNTDTHKFDEDSIYYCVDDFRKSMIDICDYYVMYGDTEGNEITFLFDKIDVLQWIIYFKA